MRLMPLLAFDLDDTLLDPAGLVPPATLAALAALRGRAYLVAVITARWRFPEELRAALRPDAVATSNGAHVRVREELAAEYVMRSDDVHAVLQAAPEDANVKALSARHLYGDVTHATPTHPVRPLRDAVHAPILKINVKHPRAADLRARFEHAPSLRVVGGEEKYRHAVTFTHANADKGEALAVIADVLGVPLRDTVAFGDSDSDLPMLRRAGRAVQVGNAACLAPVRHDAVTCATVGVPAFLRSLTRTNAPGLA